MTVTAGTLNLKIDFENGIAEVTSDQLVQAMVDAVKTLTGGTVTFQKGGIVLIRK